MLNKSRPDSYIYEIQGGKTNGIKLDIEKEYEIGLTIEDMWNLSETEVGLKVNGMNIVMDIRTGEARKWVDQEVLTSAKEEDGVSNIVCSEKDIVRVSNKNEIITWMNAVQ